MSTSEYCGETQAGPSVHSTWSGPVVLRDFSSRVAFILFGLCVAATLATWISNPIYGWAYSLAAVCLSLGLEFCAGGIFRKLGFAEWLLVAIPAWGFVQLGCSAAVYRYATWDAVVRLNACSATAFVAAATLRSRAVRQLFLYSFAWFACALSVIAILAFHTSQGRVLWTFASPYPDTWGPFLNRNHFSAFLELAFPVAVWAYRTEEQPRIGRKLLPAIPAWVPACLLAAGFASASRAGAILLLAETGLLFGFAAAARWRGKSSKPKFSVAKFAMFAVLACAIGGIGTLIARFADRDPFLYRREIAQSAIQMIWQRPWSGFGLGTFREVYPAFATFDSGAAVEHAHNDWLEWAVEGGIPFVLLWSALLGVIARAAWRSVWGLGVVAIFLHGLVDYPFARFGLTAWTFALIGAIQAEGERTASPSALIY